MTNDRAHDQARHTRRSVLQHLAATGGALITLSSLGGVSLTFGAEGEPVYGGILTTQFRSEPPNFDPIANTTSRTLYAVAPCYSKLLMFDPANPTEIIGDLATDWTTSDDGLAVTFILKFGVRFHDGVTLTSADVKHTLEMIQTASVSPRRALLSSIASIDTPDGATVVLNLNRLSPSLLATLANGWMMILPKHLLVEEGSMADKIVGTGPFKFKDYQTGVSLELVKNTDYHVPGRPYLDGITFYVVTDPATALSYFRTGQLVLYDALTSDDARRAMKEFGDLVTTPSASSVSFRTLIFNTTKAPWDDVNIRRAISLGIDRTDAAKVIVSGDGTLGGTMPAGGKWALPPELLAQVPGYSGDPAANLEEAKQIIADAGLTGHPVRIMSRRSSTFETTAVYCQSALKEMGFEVELELLEDADANERLNNGNFDLVAWNQNAGADDPDSVFTMYTCDGDRNASKLCVDDVDTLYAEQSQTADAAERKRIVNEMDLAALESSGRLILFWGIQYLGFSNRLKNLGKYTEDEHFRQMQDVWLSS